MSGTRFNLTPAPLEIDGGMRVNLTSVDSEGKSQMTLADIYVVPTTILPEGWTAGQIYYNICGQPWPRSGSILVSVSTTVPTSTTNYKATRPGTWGTGTPTLSSSSRAFVYKDSSGNAIWGVDLSGIQNIGSLATGSALWWNNSDGNITLPVGTLTLTNDTAGTSGTAYYLATDTLS
jgi:hypothetical protein